MAPATGQAIPRINSWEKTRLAQERRVAAGDPWRTITACVHGMASVSSLWLPDEAKIETEQEEDEMDDGAATADLRCFDKTCPQQGHRNIGEIEIEQNAR
jgi:hypothetical protein